MENKLNPIDVVAIHGAMTAKECALYLPDLTPKLVDEKLRKGFRAGRLARRLDESFREDGASRYSYIYFDPNGRASDLEPEYCSILRTLGKPLESALEIH
jgi:hypothetical protein